MSRILLALNGGLCAAQGAIAGIAAGCAACGGHGRGLPWIGAAGYALLAWASGREGWKRLTTPALMVASGIHAGLVAAMIVTQALCIPCVATAGLCFAATALWIRVSRSPASLVLAGCALVGSVAFLVVLPGTWMSGEPAPPPGDAKLIVYENEDCGACQKFRREVAPVLAKRALRLRLDFRPSREQRLFVYSTPMLVLLGSDGSRRILSNPFDVERLIENAESAAGPDPHSRARGD